MFKDKLASQLHLHPMLNFLKRCENETFHRVMNSASKGDLVSPVTWIEILMRAEELEPSCSLQIAANIGPLVKCIAMIRSVSSSRVVGIGKRGLRYSLG